MKKFYEDNEVTGQVAGVVRFPSSSREDLRFEVRQRVHAALDAMRELTALLEDLPADIEAMDRDYLDTEVYSLMRKVVNAMTDANNESKGWDRRREDMRSRRTRR